MIGKPAPFRDDWFTLLLYCFVLLLFRMIQEYWASQVAAMFLRARLAPCGLWPSTIIALPTLGQALWMSMSHVSCLLQSHHYNWLSSVFLMVMMLGTWKHFWLCVLILLSWYCAHFSCDQAIKNLGFLICVGTGQILRHRVEIVLFPPFLSLCAACGGSANQGKLIV